MQDKTYCSPDQVHNLCATNNGFLIVHVNIRSLTKNFDVLEELLVEIRKMPDILVISETKLQARIRFNLQGYTFIQKDSKTSAGGIGIFVKNFISFSITNKFNFNLATCEDQWIALKLGSKECVIGGIYRHPHSNINDFQNSFTKP